MRLSPFARGMLIIAAIAVVVVVLNLETSLNAINALVRVAFFLAIAFTAYLLWRDFGRREIGTWDTRSQYVFYGAIALVLVDLGWWFVSSPNGRDLLAFLLVLAACVYAAVRTWRRHHTYS
jgi:uncharacterized membrane protein YgdD (TMEM256/DUF423 family)